MEKENVVEGRSCLGMRDRFQKTILKKICSYDFLTKEQISLFREKGREKKRFSQEEDQAILSYVTNNQAYSQVGTESLWRKMKSQNVLKGRTWESIQERFQTCIMENIQSYDLTEEQIAFFKDKKGEKRKTYTTAEEKSILNYIVSNQMYSRVGGRKLWKTMEEQKGVEGRNRGSMRARFNGYIMKNLDCYGLTEEQISFFRDKKEVATGQSRSNQEYSRAEDEAILSYISHNKGYSKVGGPSMWKVMADQEVLKGRTWGSMQAHFHRTIIKNIDSYDHLSEEQRGILQSKNERQWRWWGGGNS